MSAAAPVRLPDLFVEVHGDPPTSAGRCPIVLVHGSWVDATSWQAVSPALAADRLVVAYDRRGHGRSPWAGPLPRRGHEDDLVELVERLGSPVHLVGSSYGGSIALAVAARRPELVRSVTAHEPPLLGAVRPGTALARLVDDVRRWVTEVRADLAAGRPDAGARRFFDQVLGEGVWDLLPGELRAAVAAAAPTFTAMLDDPGWDQLAAAPDAATPTLLTGGTESPPWLSGIVDELAETSHSHARRSSIDGAGHAPHLTHPTSYVELVLAFAHDAEEAPTTTRHR